MIREASGKDEEIEIISFREGEVIGMHEVVLESTNDNVYLCHDATSRRGFAEGAVRAAEWLAGKKGLLRFQRRVAGIVDTPGKSILRLPAAEFPSVPIRAILFLCSFVDVVLPL